MKKLLLILPVALISSVTALWVGCQYPVGIKIGRWFFAATPVKTIEMEIKRTQENIGSLELDLVFVDVNTMSSKSSDVVRLYMELMDALSDDGEVFVEPVGCIRTYSRGDSVAVTLEYYLDCDCTYNTSMNVLYMSVDLHGSNPVIKDSVLREAVMRGAYPKPSHPWTKGGDNQRNTTKRLSSIVYHVKHESGACNSQREVTFR